MDSNLEIALAWAAGLSLGLARRFALEVFHFLTEPSEAVVKLVYLDLHTGIAPLTDEMCFHALLELADLDCVQMPALGASNIDGFIFEHRKIPGSFPSIFGVEDTAQLTRCAGTRTRAFPKALFLVPRSPARTVLRSVAPYARR